jgi:hypothetical protein
MQNSTGISPGKSVGVRVRQVPRSFRGMDSCVEISRLSVTPPARCPEGFSALSLRWIPTSDRAFAALCRLRPSGAAPDALDISVTSRVPPTAA